MCLTSIQLQNKNSAKHLLKHLVTTVNIYIYVIKIKIITGLIKIQLKTNNKKKTIQPKNYLIYDRMTKKIEFVLFKDIRTRYCTLVL